MQTRRQSLDGCTRKRIWLMRHAEVSYVNPNGTAVADSRQVPLTDVGVKSAAMTAEVLSEVHFDRAICSGLPRTTETARIVLNDRTEPQLEVYPALEEIRGRRRLPDEADDAGQADPAQLAYTFWNTGDGHFMGGEPYNQAAERVQDTIARVLSEDGWHSMLAVCHGGVNRLILSWAISAPLSCMAPFEQDPCCVNIIDFDLDEHGKIRRSILRGVNISARDTFKRQRDLSTMEEVGLQIADAARAAQKADPP